MINKATIISEIQNHKKALYKGLYRSIYEKWKGNGFEDFKGNIDITKSKLIGFNSAIAEGLEGMLKERVVLENRLEELELELTNVEMEESKSHQG